MKLGLVALISLLCIGQAHAVSVADAEYTTGFGTTATCDIGETVTSGQRGTAFIAMNLYTAGSTITPPGGGQYTAVDAIHLQDFHGGRQSFSGVMAGTEDGGTV